tara:strand:- start:713 stop:1429 length:717 start_codon:yes stop_codon:yes gene_type:complete
MAFPQTIYGKWGWEQLVTTSQKHKLGTKMQIEDTMYVYASAGESVLAGQLMESAANISTEDEDRAVATTAAGETSVTVTFGAAITENEYKDGILFVNTGGGAGAGFRYRIKSHPAGTTVAVTLDHEAGLITALTNGTDVVGVAKPLTSGILQSNTSAGGAAVGVTMNDIASASYGWLQTQGQGVCLTQGTPTIGLGIMRSNGTDGAVELSDGSQQVIGAMGRTVGVNGEYHEVFLNLG